MYPFSEHKFNLRVIERLYKIKINENDKKLFKKFENDNNECTIE